jgi:hypothetical protein
MGCSQSANQEAESPTDRRERRGGTSPREDKESRQRNALRRTSTVRKAKYTNVDDKNDGASKGSSTLLQPDLASGRSAFDMISSDVGANNIVMSQRGSSLAGGYSMNGPLMAMTPRSTTRPNNLPRPTSQMDRRVSIGRFTDEPTNGEVRARIASAVEKAKAQHGIDGSVDETTEKQLRQSAKVGLTVLGPDGIERIQSWRRELVTLDSPTCTSPRVTSEDGAESSLPNTVPRLCDANGDAPDPMSPTTQDLVSGAMTPGKRRDEDDVDQIIFLSPKLDATTPRRPMRLTDDVLRKLQYVLRTGLPHTPGQHPTPGQD